MGRLEKAAFDSAEHLTRTEAIAAYLDLHLASSSPEDLRRAFGMVARSYGIQNLSHRSGLSVGGIYKAFSDEGNPLFETIRSVLGAMGLRLTVEPIEGYPEAP
jgi:probable addiction module antidote protein